MDIRKLREKELVVIDAGYDEILLQESQGGMGGKYFIIRAVPSGDPNQARIEVKELTEK